MLLQRYDEYLDCSGEEEGEEGDNFDAVHTPQRNPRRASGVTTLITQLSTLNATDNDMLLTTQYQWREIIMPHSRNVALNRLSLDILPPTWPNLNLRN
jgi:hypothetical protein